jgi:hypothetical protein
MILDSVWVGYRHFGRDAGKTTARFRRGPSDFSWGR